MSSVYLACPGLWREDLNDLYAYRTTTYSYVYCSIPIVERTTEAEAFRCDSGAVAHNTATWRCNVPWVRLDGLPDYVEGPGEVVSSDATLMLVCTGTVTLGVDSPGCSNGWAVADHQPKFDISHIDPATAGAFFGSGFFLCVVPLAAAWGFSQLLNMITWR